MESLIVKWENVDNVMIDTHYVGEQICSLVNEKVRYSNSLHMLTYMIAFFNVENMRHSRFGMKFVLKTAKTLF